MEKSSVESGTCPDETLNPKSGGINPNLVRDENLFSTRMKVKMEMIKKNTSLIFNILSHSPPLKSR